MERKIKDRNILDKFCEEFCAVVEKHCKYIVVSGFLAIASGRTRGTEDIDMIIERLNFDKFKSLFNDLTKNDFVCMQSSHAGEVYSYLKDNTSVRFTWKNKELPEMEVKFVKDILDDFLETDVAPTHGKLIFNDSVNKDDEHEFINNEIFKQNKLKKSLIK